MKQTTYRPALFAAALLSTTAAHSAGIAPYVSLHDSYLNGRIEQMLVVSNLPTLRKPFHVGEVRRYLPSIQGIYPGLHQQISESLKKYDSTIALTHARASVADSRTSENNTLLANARGERVESQYRMSAAAHYTPTEWLAISVGGTARESPNELLPIDSYILLGNESIQLDLGYREHWLSPFQHSAMLLSTNARPSLSVGISNPLPFDSLWNLHYEIFVARLERTDNIRYGELLESGRPLLLGTHLSFEPTAGWTIGLSRTMQFGGGSRKSDIGSVWDAFIDPVSNDNPAEGECSSVEEDNCELGNQQAAVSSRMNFPGETPFALYFEYAGEDTASFSNTRLGNLAASGGIYIPFLFDGNWSLTYEFNEWQNSWYTHGTYLNGYTNDGVGMGHWGANERAPASNAGAKAQTLEVGWQLGRQRRIEFRYQQIENASYASVDYEIGQLLSIHYRDALLTHPVSVTVLAGYDVYGEKLSRVELSMEW